MAGTFVARFSILSVTGTPTHSGGVYFISLTSQSATVNFSLTGNCFYLDGSITPISFAGLPAGFTPTGVLGLRVTGSGSATIGRLRRGDVLNNAKGTVTYGLFGPTVTQDTTVFSLSPINKPTLSPPPPAIDLISIMSVALQLILSTGGDVNLYADVFDTLEVFGNYDILAYSWDFPQSGDNVEVGDLITITSPGINPLTDLDLTHLTISMACGTVVPIIQTPTLFTFLVPAACSGSGLTTVTATGDGTQFSGSVPLGSLTILLTNGSGIYTLVVGKSSDTLYSSLRNGTTRDVKIPNPFAKTGFIGG